MSTLKEQCGKSEEKIFLLYRKSGEYFSIERIFDQLYNEFSKEIQIEKIYLPYSGFKIKSLIMNVFYLLKYRNSKVHVIGDVHYCSVFLKNSILTIHDMCHLDRAKGNYLKYYVIWLFWYYLPLKTAKAITCISNDVYIKLIKHFPFAKDKISIINNHLDPSYRYFPKEFNEFKPVILHIGTRQNKNLERVIMSIKDISCILYIIGKCDDNISFLLKKYNIDYINKYDISDKEVLDSYINSDIVSFPSLYEGFGLPIIEGQAIGRPVVTSNLSPMNQVSSDAAILVDPYNIDEIKQGFLKLINNPLLRNDLISKGLINVKKYNIVNISSMYMELYKTFFLK